MIKLKLYLFEKKRFKKGNEMPIHLPRIPQIIVIPTVLCIDGSKKCHWAENQLIFAFPG
jgi:hypothetical protein